MKYISILFFAFVLVACNQSNNESGIVEVKRHTNKSVDSTNLVDLLEEDIKVDSSLIVIDSSSKLIWMKNDFSYIKGRFLDDWNEIFEWEDSVKILKYAGFTDWRVPTIKEYRSMNKNSADRRKYRMSFNYIDSVSVWGSGAYAFWSKTTPNKHTASYISFIDGFATSGNREKKLSSKYSSYKGVELGMSVRLVRDLK